MERDPGMTCSGCGFANESGMVLCNLCGEPLQKGSPPSPPSPSQAAAEPERRTWREFLVLPWAAMGLGLLAFPIAKLLYVPNYVFNLLSTLVHEIGHALFAWLVGRPSIPTVSVAGGGVTVWQDQKIFICFLILGALGYLAWRFRKSKPLLALLVSALALYPLLAFTGMNELVAIAGGVLLEIGGAAACFWVVLAVHLRRPFERPLYALWGWWMILNRAGETFLMIRSPSYWASQNVIQSGLAAGLTSDLERLRDAFGVSPGAVLWPVLLLCFVVPGGAVGAAWWLGRRRAQA